MILGARVTHAGSATLGSASPDRLYYAARSLLQERRRTLHAQITRVFGAWEFYAVLADAPDPYGSGPAGACCTTTATDGGACCASIL